MTKIAVALAIAVVMLANNARAADVAKGKIVFDRWCAGCHAPLGKGGGFAPPAGTYTLQERYKGSLPAALEERTDLMAPYIKTMVRNGLNIMPQTRKTEISDEQLDNLIAYLTQNNH